MSARLEAVVQAGADGVEVVAAAGGGAGDGHAGVAGVDVEIFALDAPAIPDGPFQAAAERVARAPVRSLGRTARSGNAQLGVGIGPAAGAVDHHAVEGEADAAAHRGESRDLAFNRDAAAEILAGFDAGALEVAFEADHEAAELQVIAELAAIDGALGVVGERAGPAVAAIDAGVEA